MANKRRILNCITALLAAACLPVFSGCKEATAGTAVSEERIVIDGVSWVIDSEADCGLLDTDQSLGKTDGKVSYEVFTVRDDDSLLLCKIKDDTKIFRKEFRDMGTEIRTVITTNGTMDYFSFGNETGEVLVVLPGLSLKSIMGSADAITAAYAPMAEQYHVYFFDRIREFPIGYDIAAMADDTLEAFRKAGIEKAHIMGVSQGGMIALSMDLKSPETISSLLLCSSASRIPESAKACFENWKQLAIQKDARKLSEAFGQAVYSPSFFELYKDYIISANDDATELDYSNFITSIEGTVDFDVFDQLEEISCPVAVIGASEDKVLGVESSREIIDKLGCASYIYEGYGHGVYDEAPDYLEHVKDLLAKADQ